MNLILPNQYSDGSPTHYRDKILYAIAEHGPKNAQARLHWNRTEYQTRWGQKRFHLVNENDNNIWHNGKTCHLVSCGELLVDPFPVHTLLVYIEIKKNQLSINLIKGDRTRYLMSIERQAKFAQDAGFDSLEDFFKEVKGNMKRSLMAISWTPIDYIYDI